MRDQKSSINGLTFAEVKEQLESTQLLDFLTANIHKLSNGNATGNPGEPNTARLEELFLMGLVERSQDNTYPRYFLSQEGRNFFNRLKVQQRKAEHRNFAQ